MRRWLVVAAVVAGCRHKPPEPVVDEPEIPHAEQPVRKIPRFDQVDARRPDVDVSYLIADPTHDLRWPLTISDHPELVPQFDIARALAEPGVDWVDLCRLGAQHRHSGKRDQDLLQYLRGWCHVAKRDASAAVATLAPLKSSAVLILPAAIRKDLVNILIDLGGADQAEHLIAKHKLADLELLDRLAASYVELGKQTDAFQINERAIDSTQRTTEADRCRRMARRIVLGGKNIAVPEVFGIESTEKSSDPTCVTINNELQCWLKPETLCGPYLQDQKLDHINGVQLLSAFYNWPRAEASPTTWINIAWSAAAGMPLPGADRLATVALDAALRASSCSTPVMRKSIRDTAERILLSMPHGAKVDPMLSKVIETTCASDRASSR